MGYGEAGTDNSRYNGGDLAGIIERLDYIKGLGATAIWITHRWPINGGIHG
jgi:glycosidase